MADSDRKLHERCGVMLLDDPELAGSDGWSCAHGEEPIRRTHVRELTSAQIWLTNLTFMQLRHQHGNNNRLRHEGYLRNHLSSIALELGIQDLATNRAKGEACCKALAHFFESVMAAAWRLGVRGFPAGELRLAFRSRYMNNFAQKPLSEAMASYFDNATQTYTLSSRLNRHPSGARRAKYTLVVHKYSHAMEVLRHQIPVGEFRLQHTMMTPEEICNHNRPLLLRIRVHSLFKDIGELINFGGTKISNTRDQKEQTALPREWVTLPEFILLSQSGDVEVLEIYEGEGYQPNPMIDVLRQFSPAQQMSPAFLHCCDLIWSCLLKEPQQNAKDPVAAWTSTYDRLLMLKHARHLCKIDSSIDITYMGFGRISFVGPDFGTDRYRYIQSLISGTALIPQMAVAYPVDKPGFALDTPVKVLQAVMLQGLSEMPKVLDDKAFDDWDSPAASVAA